MSSPITYFNQVITSTTAGNIAEINKIYDSFFVQGSNKTLYVVVDKFKVDLAAIPLMVFNDTANYYTIELSVGAVFSGRVSLLPHFYTASPVLPVTNPAFYYIYTYDHFINILNAALAAAYAVLVAAGVVPGGNAAPFYAVDPNSHVLSLYVSHSFIEGAANQIIMHVNHGLMLQYLEGLPFFLLNDDFINPLANGRDTRVECRDRVVNQVTMAGQLYYQQASNAKADTVVKWNICKGIVITSGLRTRREAFPSGEGIDTPFGIVNNSLKSSDILMNFDVLYQDIARPLLLTYTASNFDKKILLKDRCDLNEISLKFYWYDKFNQLYPIHLVGNDCCSIRIGFTE